MVLTMLRSLYLFQTSHSVPLAVAEKSARLSSNDGTSYKLRSINELCMQRRMLRKAKCLHDTSAYMWHTIRNRSRVRTETSAIGWSPSASPVQSFPERNVHRQFSPEFLTKIGSSQILVTDLLVKAGLCDSVEASRLIHSGAITVDGEVFNSHARFINPAVSSVSVAGRPLEDCVTISYALHKPSGFTCTARDALKRPSVFSFLPNPNWYYKPADIINFNCSGLIILSNSHLRLESEEWEIDLNGKVVRDWELETWPFENPVDRIDENILRVKTRLGSVPRRVYSSMNTSVKLKRLSLGQYSLEGLKLPNPGNSSTLVI